MSVAVSCANLVQSINTADHHIVHLTHEYYDASREVSMVHHDLSEIKTISEFLKDGIEKSAGRSWIQQLKSSVWPITENCIGVVDGITQISLECEGRVASNDWNLNVKGELEQLQAELEHHRNLLTFTADVLSFITRLPARREMTRDDKIALGAEMKIIWRRLQELKSALAADQTICGKLRLQTSLETLRSLVKAVFQRVLDNKRQNRPNEKKRISKAPDSECNQTDLCASTDPPHYPGGAVCLIQEPPPSSSSQGSSVRWADPVSKIKVASDVYVAEFANHFEPRSELDHGIVSSNRAVAAVIRNESVYFYDVRPSRRGNKFLGGLDFRPGPFETRKYRKCSKHMTMRMCASESLDSVRFLTSDGSLVMVTRCNFQSDIYHWRSKTLVHRFSSDQRSIASCIAISPYHGLVVFLRKSPARDGRARMSVCEISNESMDPATPKVLVNDRVIGHVDWGLPFRFSHDGKYVAIMRTSCNTAPDDHVTLLYPGPRSVEKREITLQFPPGYSEREGFRMRTFAGNEKEFVMVVNIADDKIAVMVWSIKNGTLKRWWEMGGADEVVLTDDGQFLWSGLDETPESWHGMLTDLSTFETVRHFGRHERFYFIDNYSAMTRSLAELHTGRHRVEVQNIVREVQVRSSRW